MTIKYTFFLYIYIGDNMRVKIFDENHEKDLELVVNDFLKNINKLVDIKYQVAIGVCGEEQIFCFSALIIYN